MYKVQRRLPTKDQKYNLWALLDLVRHAIMRVRQKELNKYNVSVTQGTVLLIIEALGDEATPNEISRWLFREPQSVSGLLSRMKKQGLLYKVRDLDKKNMMRVVLTEKGREAYYYSAREEAVRSIMSSLSEDECQQLASCLYTLWGKALEKLGIVEK